MLKRTIYVGNPAYLHYHNAQLVVKLPEVEKNAALPLHFKKEAAASIPIEDIGVLVLDHRQITVTQSVFAALLAHNAAVITCDEQHLPTGLLLNLAGHTLQSAKFKAQLGASQALCKNLWQQTVKAKIKNQAQLVQQQQGAAQPLYLWAGEVKTGDHENHEARAAAYYWKHVFPQLPHFKRQREGLAPNLWLNYAYALIRAVVARALVGSGLLPTMGIFHRNQYNHYCLADDIMEPYRPFADQLIAQLLHEQQDTEQGLSPFIKQRLLGVLTTDVLIGGERSPLMVAVQRSTASLAKCFEQKSKKLLYPELPCA